MVVLSSTGLVSLLALMPPHQEEIAPRAAPSPPATARPVLVTAAVTFLPPSVLLMVWDSRSLTSDMATAPLQGWPGTRARQGRGGSRRQAWWNFVVLRCAVK